MIRYPSTVPDSSDADLDAFFATCDRLGGFDPALDAERVDGFLTALAAGLRLPETDDWIAALCGDAFERSHADPDDRAHGLRVLQSRLDVLLRQLDPEALLDDPDAIRLAPLMTVIGDDERRAAAQDGASDAELASLHTGAEWARGVDDAIAAFPATWTPPSADAADDAGDPAQTLRTLREQVAVLREPDGSDAVAAHAARWWPGRSPTRDELIDEALRAMQELRLFWVDHAPRTAPRRVAPAPGRNDPCPCGSGRKYKKCHGGAAG